MGKKNPKKGQGFQLTIKNNNTEEAELCHLLFSSENSCCELLPSQQLWTCCIHRTLCPIRDSRVPSDRSVFWRKRFITSTAALIEALECNRLTGGMVRPLSHTINMLSPSRLHRVQHVSGWPQSCCTAVKTTGDHVWSNQRAAITQQPFHQAT